MIFHDFVYVSLVIVMMEVVELKGRTAENIIEISNILEQLLQQTYNPTPIFIKLCAIFEAESKIYFDENRRYFDEDFPYRTVLRSRDSKCGLVLMHWVLIKHEEFLKINLLNYLFQNMDHALNVVACRFLMIHKPRSLFVNHTNEFVLRLFDWASKSNCTSLQTYATGLLVECLVLPDVATKYIEENNYLIPIILARLQLYCKDFTIKHQHCEAVESNQQNEICCCNSLSWVTDGPIVDFTNNWIQTYPITITTKIVYCLKYLVIAVKYQKFSKHAYEILNLVMEIINSSVKQNSHLTLKTLQYLATLLTQKQFATEFLVKVGIQKLLEIPNSSKLSTDVAMCLRNLSYYKVEMERICLPVCVYDDLVSNSFHFKIILEMFDNHDGLRILINMLIKHKHQVQLNTVVQFCDVLKHYFEAHLHIKTQQIRFEKMNPGLIFSLSKYTNKSEDEVYEEIELVMNVMPMKNHWTPVGNLIKFGGLNLLVQIIRDRYYDNEIMKNALQVLNICSATSKGQLALFALVPEFEGVNLPFVSMNECEIKINVNSNILRSLTEQNDFSNQIVLKTLLYIIITCVSPPKTREEESIVYCSENESAENQDHKTNGDMVIEQNWDCIRNNNLILFLLNLIVAYKVNVDDIDEIRGLATRALAGLAHCAPVCQFLRNLTLFNSGQFQSLMINPINQKNRLEHLKFLKYALELMELLSGITTNNEEEIKTSLANINQIYDVETSIRIMKLVPKYPNKCFENYPVFDSTNKTLLSDCILWDTTSYRQIHKFDKLNNSNFNGIFHPNGYEIVIHTEVWDIRTFRLLRTVPSLDKCKTIFSGEGIYAYDRCLPNLNKNNIIKTSFKTLDPYDYSDIATIDIESPVYHMVCNSNDTQISIVGYTNTPRFSVVRIYDVGRSSTII
ncbi:Armadillo-type fold,WD40/YVTN repeat-like-containing domain,WD40-repeat-containing domain [Cinara cedri]|uniref:Armadillo-type fold,WD40/YVTN repeat-like-containing domain,WD40-repeat-containing domain n=1 Tax=Cinara cedri TaxID=506608 RepID=A0A5E4MIL1_9HEMI|nr:Armadillo-type fold,WD40/YVTN repeat-like-containing domain,WD40-repeat-containing domain [Cinara cedri]